MPRDPTPAGTILVDGQEIDFYTADTVGSCLMRAGILRLRTASAGDPRGMFCGIGICNECLITIDTRVSARACLVPARAGLVAVTEEPRS